MSRIEFISELESLLLDIPLDERQEAIQYYNDYFEEAGKDHEDAIMKELGSPVRIASIIKADLNANASDNGSRGYFTEKGYQDTIYNDPKYEIIGAEYKETGEKKEKTEEPKFNQETRRDNHETKNENNQQNRYNNNTRIALLVLLCIFAIPIGLPIIVSTFSVAFAIIATIVGLFIGFGVSGIACIIGGIVLIVLGILKMIAIPLLGMLLCGSGLIVLGIGLLFVLLSVILCKNVLPALVKGFVSLCRLPFKNRSVTA